jgi:RimJ/RimL family protein N-acetyltransferase
MLIEFKRLSTVQTADIVRLMNDPKVRRHMPLTKDDFDEKDCADFIAAKEQLWKDHGFGPWAFFVGDRFAGWGGLQPEGNDVDLALVLDPKHWGLGKRIFEEIVARTRGDARFDCITVQLPKTRRRLRALARLGFECEGTVEAYGHEWVRFRRQLIRRDSRSAK